jgi:hypothetical protein
MCCTDVRPLSGQWLHRVADLSDRGTVAFDSWRFAAPVYHTHDEMPSSVVD